MRKVIFILVVLLSCFACSPRIIERVVTKIEYRDKLVKDSVFVHDSIWQKEYVKGDTVYLNKYVYKYLYKDKFVHDTSYVAVHDTTTVTKEVPAKLTWIQKAKLDSYWWLLAILVVLLLWTFRKPLLNLLKRT